MNLSALFAKEYEKRTHQEEDEPQAEPTGIQKHPQEIQDRQDQERPQEPQARKDQYQYAPPRRDHPDVALFEPKEHWH